MLTPADAEALFGLPLHPQVEAWLRDTAGQPSLPGGLNLRGAEAVPQQGLPLEPWTARFAEDFPALSVGSDSYGHEFWVHVTSAQVISVHHDSLDESLAGVSLPKDKDAATARVLAGRAPLDLDTVLAVHRALAGVDDDPVSVMHAVCDATGWDIRAAAARLEGEAGLAFLWVRARDLIEGDGLGELAAARTTLAQLAEGPAAFKRKRKLVLAQAGLRALPEVVGELTGMKTIDLRGNPHLDMAQAMAVLAKLPKLQDLSLAACRLREPPAGLAALSTLKKLNLSDNPLAKLPEMPSLSDLQQINLKETPLDDASLVQGFRDAHPDCVLLLARPLHPAGLGRAFADPERTEVVDLSIGYSDDHARVTELPALARLPQLKVVRVSGQRDLTLPKVLTAIAGTQLVELDARGVRANERDDLETLFEQRRLEVLRLRGDDWRPPALHALFRYAAEQPKLRELECLRGRQDVELPASQIEALTLNEASDSWDEDEPPLPAVPRGIERQSKLHTLKLQGYRVRLPERLAELPALRHLTITAEPQNAEVLGALHGLEVLELAQKSMTGFPDLRALTKLRRLALTHHSADVGALVAQLGAWPALEDLELIYAGLQGEHLAAISACAGLKRLVLQEQHGKTGPLDLRAFTQLEELDLQDVAPERADALVVPSLKRLRWHGDDALSNERLAAITENRGLEELAVADHGLTQLPASFAQLGALRALKLSAWRRLDLDKQPEIFGDMPHLERVELGGMSGSRLPEGLLALPLKELRISSMEGLDWAVVFKQLAQIPTLENLEVVWGRCVAIPPEIAALQSLTKLMVHQCGLKTVAKEIASLKGLQRLQITVNPLASGQSRKLRKAMPWCEIWT